jgi:hypothetical protein
MSSALREVIPLMTLMKDKQTKLLL